MSTRTIERASVALYTDKGIVDLEAKLKCDLTGDEWKPYELRVSDIHFGPLHDFRGTRAELYELIRMVYNSELTRLSESDY
jgi:hypothetical protein